MGDLDIQWLTVSRNLLSWLLHVIFLPITFVIRALENLYWIYENRHHDMELAWPWEHEESE